jgi:hypothetical protein
MASSPTDVHNATGNSELIAWMAEECRLFIYRCEVETGSKQSETFMVMERRLLKATWHRRRRGRSSKQHNSRDKR